MTVYRVAVSFALLSLGACAAPEQDARLDADVQLARSQVERARAELGTYRSGSVVYDLVALRLAVHQQTLAMLEQKQIASRWYPAHSYTIAGELYKPPADLPARIEKTESQLQKARGEWKHHLELEQQAPELLKPLYAMGAATRAVSVAQLEYQLAAYRNEFPPYATIQQAQASANPLPRPVTLPEPK